MAAGAEPGTITAVCVTSMATNVPSGLVVGRMPVARRAVARALTG